MFLRRLPHALSCLALMSLCLGGPAARADVTSASASAFGVHANVDLSATVGGVGVSVGPTPTVSGSAPSPFNNSASAANVAASASIATVIVGSLNIDTLDVTAQSDATGTGAATTRASASVTDLNILLAADASLGFGTVALLTLGLGAVESTAQVTGDIGALVPSGDTTIFNGTFKIGVLDLSATVFASLNPTANTTFTINDAFLVGFGGVAGSVTGSITVILNEQIFTGDGNTNSGITVNAINIKFNSFARTTNDIQAPLTLSGRIIVSQSQANQTAQAPGGGGGGGGGGGAQPVPEPSSLAMLGVVGLIGAVRRFRQRRIAVPKLVAI